MHKILLNSLIAVSALYISGCASMFGDNTRTVKVNSKPSGANVYLNGINYGVTPTSINLPNYLYTDHTIIVKKSGYQDKGVLINGKFQPVGLLNFIFLPGFVVDAATGNALKVDPNQLNLDVDMTAAK